MKKLLISLFVACGFALSALPAAANEGGYPWDKFPEEKMTDMASLQNGARIFVNYCLNCHSAQYMRYNRLQRHRPERRPDQEEPAVRHREGRRHDEDDARPEAGEGLLRRRAARSLGDRPLARRDRQGQRRRLPLHPVAHLLPRRRQADRLEQPRVPRHRHAARALAAAGRTPRRLRRGEGRAPSRQDRAPLRALRAGDARAR